MHVYVYRKILYIEKLWYLGGHIIFAFSAIRRHTWFLVISRKSIYPIFPNLVWVFIGLIACMGLLLVKIAV